MSSVEINVASGIVIRSEGSELWHDAAVPGHIREAATVGEFLDEPRPGIILADCSCGAEYEVPQGDDEYGALEKAHREHVAAATPACPHGDPACPCPDGLACHYEPAGDTPAWPRPGSRPETGEPAS